MVFISDPSFASEHLAISITMVVMCKDFVDLFTSNGGCLDQTNLSSSVRNNRSVSVCLAGSSCVWFNGSFVIESTGRWKRMWMRFLSIYVQCQKLILMTNFLP
jgi:hypothetical protein